jgi:RyR and IP3R Homology associated
MQTVELTKSDMEMEFT